MSLYRPAEISAEDMRLALPPFVSRDEYISMLLEISAGEIAVLQGWIWQALEESHMSLALHTLGWWEEIMALSGNGLSAEQRRANLQARKRASGTATRERIEATIASIAGKNHIEDREEAYTVRIVLEEPQPIGIIEAVNGAVDGIALPAHYVPFYAMAITEKAQPSGWAGAILTSYGTEYIGAAYE